MLLPNNKQITKLFQYGGTSRFAYNWALNKIQDDYNNGVKFRGDCALRREFTQLKKTPEFYWLNDYSNNITKQAIKDCCKAQIDFMKGKKGKPKFKSKKKSQPAFYVDPYKIKFTDTHVKLEKLTTSKKARKQKFNWVRLAETNRIPTDCKYQNPRVTFDGMNFWISVSVEVEDNDTMPDNQGIGIDLGVANLAVCSDGNTYKNINKTAKVKKTKKKLKRIQRKVSKKYFKNKKGGKFHKTNNIKKTEKQLLKLNRRLTNIRCNYLHQTTTEIINRKPMFIAVEDLNISGMLKNRHLANAIQEQGFNIFDLMLKYKAERNNIKVIDADMWYPSSKTCSSCGSIKKDLKLNDRVFKCPVCGLKLDRDYNASVNLQHYGQSVALSA
jgi:putative transposase